jgi:hypothetical protein
LFFYNDWVEEILTVVFSNLNLSNSNTGKYIEFLESIPNIQKQKEISHILKSNKNELADLKTVTNRLLDTQLTTEYINNICG